MVGWEQWNTKSWNMKPKWMSNGADLEGRKYLTVFWHWTSKEIWHFVPNYTNFKKWKACSCKSFKWILHRTFHSHNHQFAICITIIKCTYLRTFCRHKITSLNNEDRELTICIYLTLTWMKIDTVNYTFVLFVNDVGSTSLYFVFVREIIKSTIWTWFSTDQTDFLACCAIWIPDTKKIKVRCLVHGNLRFQLDVILLPNRDFNLL